MTSLWADIKAYARQTVQATFGREATYAAPGSVADPVAVRVRWHAAGARVGDLSSGGYADIVTTNDRVIFDQAELDALGVTPERGGLVTITDEVPALVLRLDTQAEKDGPIVNSWIVTR